ncbi:MAG: macro domain-containing protein [Bacteroidota bacterium]
MRKVNYIKGDATFPQAEGVKIIAHICNDVGAWGKGFVLAISKRWKEPEAAYRLWYRNRIKNDFQLGNIAIVQVEEYVYVANMIGQKGIKIRSRSIPVRYDAVQECLKKLSIQAKKLEASVHMPRIGCGLAGGRWDEVEPLINATLMANNIETFVYDFK